MLKFYSIIIMKSVRFYKFKRAFNIEEQRNEENHQFNHRFIVSGSYGGDARRLRKLRNRKGGSAYRV